MKMSWHVYGDIAIFNSTQYEAKFSCIAGVGLNGVYSSTYFAIFWLDHNPI